MFKLNKEQGERHAGHGEQHVQRHGGRREHGTTFAKIWITLIPLSLSSPEKNSYHYLPPGSDGLILCFYIFKSLYRSRNKGIIYSLFIAT